MRRGHIHPHTMASSSLYRTVADTPSEAEVRTTSLLERLDGELAHRELDQRDTDSVLEIIQALSEAARDWRSGMFQSVPIFDQAQVTIAPGVKARLALWMGVNIEVRAHIFRNSAETPIHDHGQNFISVCVDGAYQHNLWAVDSKAVGSHYMWNRAVGGALTSLGEVPGQLNMIAFHTHANGLPLFVSKHCLHTIESSHARVVTITLHDRRKKTDPTRILSPIPSIEAPTGQVRVAADYEQYISSVMELVHVLANFPCEVQPVGNDNQKGNSKSSDGPVESLPTAPNLVDNDNDPAPTPRMDTVYDEDDAEDLYQESLLDYHDSAIWETVADAHGESMASLWLEK